MKKKTIFLLLLTLLTTSVWAQSEKPLSEAESQKVITALTQAASSMQTMQCRFVQSKNMAMLVEPSVSEGKMYFDSPDRLRWEYLTPNPFALVVNGDRIVKVTNGQVEVLEGNAGRMYQGIVTMIMGSASGQKLFDASSFDMVFYDDGDFWKSEMTPKRRDMKRMFSLLVFHFDKKTQVIDHVEFIEPKGDKTTIQFEDIRLNEVIGEEKFQ